MIPAAAPAPAHCPPQTDIERTVNPAHHGPKYNEIHDSVVKNDPKALREWQSARGKFEVVVATAEGVVIAAAMRQELQSVIDEIDKLAACITKTKHIMEVKNKGDLSDTDLIDCKKCEEAAAKTKHGAELSKLIKGATDLAPITKKG